MDYSALWDKLAASSDDEALPFSGMSAGQEVMATTKKSCQAAPTPASKAANDTAVHIADAVQKEEAVTPRVARWLESLASVRRAMNPRPELVVVPDDCGQPVSKEMTTFEELEKLGNHGHNAAASATENNQCAKEGSAMSEIPRETAHVKRGVSWQQMVNRVKFPSEEAVLAECNRIIAR